MIRELLDKCRGCGSVDIEQVDDFGSVPAADDFPLIGSDPRSDALLPLDLWLCRRCLLVQLGVDRSAPEEPRGLEPSALRLQAREAIGRLRQRGLLDGMATVREFGSPHGGSWLGEVSELRHVDDAADLIIDSFGIMHEPDQESAFAERARCFAPGGLMAFQFHSAEAILRGRQWNMIRHGHFAYYSLTAALDLLARAGLRLIHVEEFSLYGGTILAVVRRSQDHDGDVDDRIERVLLRERAAGVTDPAQWRSLAHAAEETSSRVRRTVVEGGRVVIYGAASRTVAVLAKAGVTSAEVHAVVDAAEAKHGRRMPGTDIPIVAPGVMEELDPDVIHLSIPELASEISAAYPQFAGRIRTDLFG